MNKKSSRGRSNSIVKDELKEERMEKLQKTAHFKTEDQMIKTEKLKSKDKKKDKLVKIKSLYNSDKVNEQSKTI